jgi:hypothetical protein
MFSLHLLSAEHLCPSSDLLVTVSAFEGMQIVLHHGRMVERRNKATSGV